MKKELTVRELLELAERANGLDRNDAGTVLDFAYEWPNEDGPAGIASFEWDGLHFYGDDTNSRLLKTHDERLIWDLGDFYL